MRRTVFYDAESSAAATAASVLVDEFDVLPVPAGARPGATPAVLIVDGERARPGRLEHVHVIALVDPQARGPWPEHWYALLPHGVGSPILARAVANAFADLEAAAEIRRLGYELSELNAIGIRLSAERNPDALLELILRKAREITESDAGSLYLVEDGPEGGRRLFFALTQNDSITTVPFQAARLPLDSASIAGHVALSGKTVSLDDAYRLPPGSPYNINRSFDEQTGYHTKSMLVVPMRTPPGETMGVLQLINCKPGVSGPLAGRDAAERVVRSYSSRHEALAESLASQAAVAVDNNRLYQSIRLLFEGFVGAAVTAIESRDPTTSGHSFRVAELTVGLAETVDRCAQGRFATTRLTVEEVREIRYAALLHDFGKVGVREHVLLKAKKLYPAELDRIRARVALIKRSLQLRQAHVKLDYLLNRGRRGYDRQASRLDGELATRLAELDAIMERIVMANEPALLRQDIVERIEQLARQVVDDGEDGPLTVITPEEGAILAIARGSLTEEEIREIRSHVVHTFQFLAQIPWTKEFRRVPEIARSHHEKLDGSGYPHGITGDEIPVQSRMMTIADIYDALTASDRPYKAAVPVDKALDILEAERRAGAIDGDLLDLFLAAKVYERTLPRRERS